MAGEEVHTVWDHAGLRGAAQREAEVGRQKGNHRRQLDDVDKFAFVQSMGIDPIKESEMIWVAEEAMTVMLPPGWTEQLDDRGRPFFFHAITGQSSWYHPMHEVFQDLVTYHRQVVHEGGFWMVEDQLTEHEEKIRRELADWQELFDEKGHKFYYNRQSEESRFEDPRHGAYHCLYTRIKIVGKMRERLPHLAAVPRPEAPEVIRARRREEKQRKAEERVTLRMQSVFRMMMARRKAQELQKRRMMNLVPLSQQSELKLNLKRSGFGAGLREDLVIALPSGRRRHLALLKLQAFFRGCLARSRYRGMVKHRTQRRRCARKIQLYYRLYMQAKWAACALVRQRTAAARTILQMAHSRRGRRAFQDVLDNYARERWHFLRCVVKLQSFFRARPVRIAFKARRDRGRAAVVVWQSAWRRKQAQRQLAGLFYRHEPAQLTFSPNGDSRTAWTMPWSWNLLFLPLGEEGLLGSPHCIEDLFAKGGTGSPAVLAAMRIQKTARGKVGRRLARERDQFLRAEVRRKAKEAARLPFSAVEVQRRWKGFLVRKRDVLGQRRQALMAEKKEETDLVLAFFFKNKEQEQLMDALRMEKSTEAATAIQTEWRRHTAKAVGRQLREESLWPLKGRFEFFATGTEAVRCSVRFYANPTFDYETFHDQKGLPGTGYSLPELLDSMEDEVEACVRRFLAEQEEREKAGEALKGSDWLDMLVPVLVPEEPSQPPSELEEEREQEEEPEVDLISPTMSQKKPYKAPIPKGLERMHYAGMVINGRFIKSTINLDQMNGDDQQAIMVDIQADRERRLEEMRAKQQRYAEHLMKQQREAAKRMAETRKALRKTSSFSDLLPVATMPPPRSALLADMMDDPLWKRFAMTARMQQQRSEPASKTFHSSPSSVPTSPAAKVGLPQLTSPASGASLGAAARTLHAHSHKHQQQVLWGAGSQDSSPSAGVWPKVGSRGRGSTDALPRLPIKPSSAGSLRERALSAGELARFTEKGVARGLPLTQSGWSPKLPADVDSFAATVKQSALRGDLLQAV